MIQIISIIHNADSVDIQKYKIKIQKCVLDFNIYKKSDSS